ncbi:hypothetical protein ACFW16_11740 [Inquilinus sp. NPDC058860]|uniref:hypothetical protein n=1 Tax=Inquilinus sp. NPDC058860 TaxID=3346652 RepID=UPI0036A1C407
MRSFLFIASFGLATVFCGLASAQMAPSGQGLAPGGPPPAQLVMPAVPLETGTRFLADRVVPPSDVPALTTVATPATKAAVGATAAAAAPQGRPVLGHPLPTDAVSPSGFPRADFAIAPKGQGDKPASPLGAGKIQ